MTVMTVNHSCPNYHELCPNMVKNEALSFGQLTFMRASKTLVARPLHLQLQLQLQLQLSSVCVRLCFPRAAGGAEAQNGSQWTMPTSRCCLCFQRDATCSPTRWVRCNVRGMSLPTCAPGSTRDEPELIYGTTCTKSKAVEPLVSFKTNSSLQKHCFPNLLYHSALTWFACA
jgi:hypothetical protein